MSDVETTQGELPSSASTFLLDDQLCFALYAASHEIQRLYRPILAKHEVTYPQFLVLLVLWEHDGQSVGEVGARLGLDTGTLTPLLKRMEAAGLLCRARSVVDERRVEVSITDHARSLREVIEAETDVVRCSAAEAAGQPGLLLERLGEFRSHIADVVGRRAGGQEGREV